MQNVAMSQMQVLLSQAIEERLVSPTRIKNLTSRITGIIDELDQPSGRQASRCFIMQAAHEAIIQRLPFLAQELKALSKNSSGSRLDWLVDDDCLEATSPLSIRGRAGRMSVSVAPAEQYPISAAALGLIDEEDLSAVGEGWETKYRGAALHCRTNKHYALTVVPDRWETAAGFHRHLRLKGGFLLNQDGCWLEPVPFGRDCLPGIISIHVVVLTNDNKVLFAQRASTVAYAPGSWSTTFEEQLTAIDFGRYPDPLASAVYRGFHEEFGIQLALGSDTAIVLSTILEMRILNLAVVVALRPNISANDIVHSWRSKKLEADPEIASLESFEMPANEDEIQTFINQRPLHPTSTMRLRMLLRWSMEQK